MIDSRLSPEHEALRKSVAEFACDVIAPVIGDFYKRREFPYEIVAKLGRMGVFGLPVAEEYGGMGGDYFALCLVLEELSRVDSSVAVTVEAAVSSGIMPVYRYGTEEQKRQWLPGLCSGEMLGAFGLTEPCGASDVPGALRTHARLEGGEWVINGTKAFIANSGTDITGFVAVAALTGDGPERETSTILVPAGTPGFTTPKRYSRAGWSASDIREISFNDCRVPEGNLLGTRGRSSAQIIRMLDEGRIAIAALATGLAQGCLDESVRYVGRRQASGVPSGHHQAIASKVADMAASSHAARLAWQHAAAKMLAGEPFKKEAAIAKLVASNAAMDNAREATQIFGTYGVMNDFPVGRFYRDASILQAGEGSSEVQRTIIALELGVPTPELGVPTP